MHLAYTDTDNKITHQRDNFLKLRLADLRYRGFPVPDDETVRALVDEVIIEVDQFLRNSGVFGEEQEVFTLD